MQPEGTFSQSEIEVTDPIVTDNLLRMHMDFSYKINVLIPSPIARTQRPLKGIAKMRQLVTKPFKSMTRLL